MIFFRTYFSADLIRDNDLTDGLCLCLLDRMRFLIYKEDADAIRIHLPEQFVYLNAVAVDACKPYAERAIDFDDEGMWSAPYISDWVIAVGKFNQ